MRFQERASRVIGFRCTGTDRQVEEDLSCKRGELPWVGLQETDAGGIGLEGLLPAAGEPALLFLAAKTRMPEKARLSP